MIGEDEQIRIFIETEVNKMFLRKKFRQQFAKDVASGILKKTPKKVTFRFNKETNKIELEYPNA